MGRAWQSLHAFLRFYRFDRPDLEAQFEEKYRRSGVQACRLWIITQLPLAMLFVLSSTLFLSRVDNVLFWALFSVPLFCAVLLTLLYRCGVATDQRLNYALALCYCLTQASRGIQFSLFLDYHQSTHWGLTAIDPAAEDLVGQMAAYMFVVIGHIDQQIQLLPVLTMGFCSASVVATLCGPVIMLLLITVGMSLRPLAFVFFAIPVISAAINVVFSCDMSLMRRSIFLLELQRANHVEQMQRADAMINHIVKNAMVEAAGLIGTFLDLCVPPPPPEVAQAYLHCAVERLRSGMAWCKRRRVLLELMTEAARPNPTPTSLAALGTAVVSSRPITTSFADLVVELDVALTDLILENAINNAFRHGHPTDPDVRFAISADCVDPTTGTCVVAFRITNRCNPNNQPLSAAFLQQTLWQDPTLSPSVPFAEGVGLRHCFLAASLQGMAVSLAQEGDTVVFQASVPTRLVAAPLAPASPISAGGDGGRLPLGLTVAAIDDSPTARMLLKHQLSRDIAGCTIDVFGASADDVQPFLAHTLQKADIAILDQHLDWSSGTALLGTDLVRMLLQAGFHGLICMRSANVSEQDVSQYFAVGAHCVLDKLLDRAQAVATLAHHYCRLRAMPQSRASSPVALEALTRRPAALTDDQQSTLFGMVACEESA